MTQSVLKLLRLVAPGLIIALLATFVGLVTKTWKGFSFTSADDVMASLYVLVFGGLYYASPLPWRDWAIGTDMRRVQENLRSGLVKLTRKPDKPDLYTWKALRPLFFDLVDHDQSLSIKAKMAYFNGFFMTTVADFRVIALVFALLSLALTYWHGLAALVSAIFLAIGALLTFPMSKRLYEQHVEIGNQQLEQIQLKYLQRVIERLAALDS